MSLGQLIEAMGTFLYLAIFARVILSWFPTGRGNPIVQFIFAITEPILAPIRRVVPRFGMLDLTPMIALILVALIQAVLLRALA
ncbi:MAG: YggT family protein [Dehalococcoidia bacterium]